MQDITIYKLTDGRLKVKVHTLDKRLFVVNHHRRSARAGTANQLALRRGLH